MGSSERLYLRSGTPMAADVSPESCGSLARRDSTPIRIYHGCKQIRRPIRATLFGAQLKTPSTGVKSVDFEGFRIWACSADTGVMWEFLGAVFQCRSQWDLDV
jgi:hypothetical protein